MKEILMNAVENWYMILAGLAAFGTIGAAVHKFVKLPKAEKETKVKEWLLWAVTNAEKELGSGTGQLKLRQVYDLFLQRFPKVAAKVSFDLFGKWVDEALTKMRKMIVENKAVDDLVRGETNGR